MAIKKTYKVFLTETTYNKLLAKAHKTGFEGRGCLSHLLEKLGNEDWAFIQIPELKQFLDKL